MNSQVFKSVDTAREDDDRTHIVDELDLSELGSMSLDSYDEDIEQLKMKIEVQKEIIDDLASSMSEMEVGYKVKIAMKDDELDSLRAQCENYRRIIRESQNDNSPPRDVKQLCDPSQSTPEVTEKTVGRTDDLDSGLVWGLKDCPAAASSESFHKAPSTIGDEPTDSCLATSAGLDEKSAIADFIVLNQVTAERIDETRVDSVEEKSCDVIPVILMAHDHKCTGTVNATAVNDINENRTEKKVDGQKAFNPMSALEELCVHRNWTLPKYEYIEVDSSEPFYTVECTVMTCTVKAGGRSKEEAERKVAAMLYNTVKHSSRKSSVPLETKSEKYSSTENRPIDTLNGDVASAEGNQVSIELVRDLKNEHEHIGTVETPMSCITKQCTENVKPEELLTSNPISALQNLCVSRNWRIPAYEFFEEGRSTFIYSAECTVMTCTVRVEGLLKKDAKRQAAKVMYEKVKNFTCYKDFPTAILSGKSAASSEGNCQKPTNELTGRSEEKPVEHERVGTVVTALNCNNYTKIDRPEKDMDTKLRYHPTCVLQELCTSRKWPMPGYEYFENIGHLGARTYTVKCTVLACSVKAEGLSKKAAKRQAATMMYQTIENGENVGFGETTMDRGQ